MSTSDTINERQTYLVVASFYDEDDAAVTPSAATYRIHDRDSGIIIKAVTSIGSLSTSVTIEVTSAENALIRHDAQEVHVLTLEFDYGSSRHGNGEHTWTVKALLGA